MILLRADVVGSRSRSTWAASTTDLIMPQAYLDQIRCASRAITDVFLGVRDILLMFRSRVETFSLSRRHGQCLRLLAGTLDLALAFSGIVTLAAFG
jgi:hypothetical protein